MRIFGFLVVGFLVLTSCKKQTMKEVEKSIVEGQWKVTLYQEDGVNETSYFSSIKFDFNDDGQVLVKDASSNTIYTGTWSVRKDSDHVEFELNLGTTDPLEKLTDDWHVEDHSDAKLELKDESGDGSIELLTFEKI